MSHTKGPWHVSQKGFEKVHNENKIQIYATNDDLEMICQVWKDGLLHDKIQDHRANATLIAAAPELLEALDSLVSGYHHGMGTSAMQIRFDIARDILNKAKGI